MIRTGFRTLAGATVALMALAVQPAIAGGVLTIGKDQDSTTFDPIKTAQNTDSAPCGSRRFRPDGARRLRRYCGAKRAGTRGSCRPRLRTRLHQDFGRLR